MAENFETIGRYVAAKEEADSLSGQRHNILGELSRLVANVLNAGRYGESYSKFDSKQATDLIERAKDLDAKMMAAVDEANKHAAAAKKPVLKKV